MKGGIVTVSLVDEDKNAMSGELFKLESESGNGLQYIIDSQQTEKMRLSVSLQRCRWRFVLI